MPELFKKTTLNNQHKRLDEILKCDEILKPAHGAGVEQLQFFSSAQVPAKLIISST